MTSIVFHCSIGMVPRGSLNSEPGGTKRTWNIDPGVGDNKKESLPGSEGRSGVPVQASLSGGNQVERYDPEGVTPRRGAAARRTLGIVKPESDNGFRTEILPEAAQPARRGDLDRTGSRKGSRESEGKGRER